MFSNTEINEGILNEIINVSDSGYSIKEENLEIYFQPIVDVKTGKIFAAEALARFNSKEHGLIYPSQFLEVLNGMGLLYDLDFKVLEKCCKWLQRRAENGQELVVLSCNFSRKDFDGNFMSDFLMNVVSNTECPHKYICLEITEHEGHTVEVIKDFVDAIKNLFHIKFAIDDFSEGITSIHDLAIPYDILKLDKSVMARIKDEKWRNNIKGIIDVIHSGGQKVVGEGLETREELMFLRDVGCDYVQGNLIQGPISESAFDVYLDKYIATFGVCDE